MAKDKEQNTTVDFGGVEINSDSKEYVDTNFPAEDIRVAYAIFIPNIEQNPYNPPIVKAMSEVNYEASKVAFKYDQEENWKYYYGLVVDSKEHGCTENGTPAVMIHMPYSTHNETMAKEELIIYVKEIAVLCGISDVVLNYNVNIAFHVHCEYTDEDNKCLDTFDSFTYEELKVNLNISCTIETTIQFAGLEFYKAITSIGNKLDPTGIIYYQAGMFVYGKDERVSKCQMISSNIQVQNLYGLKIPKLYEESISKEIEMSDLKINNFTVI